MPLDPTSPVDSAVLPCSPESVDLFLSAPSEPVVQAVSRAPGPIVVLGAGGKIGLHLCAMLQRACDRLGRRDRVVAVSRFRTLRDRRAFAAFGVETVPCDLTDAAALARLPEAPTVFFLAGVKFGTASAPELLELTNVKMPRQVGERYRRSRIVAFSSGCVYPFVAPSSRGATEGTPVEPIGEYAASCVARERAFSDLSRRHGTKVALIRLNYSVEFRYGILVDIAERVLAGAPLDVTMGYVNAIWQSDAVAHAIQALELAEAPPAPVNIAGAEILSVRRLAHRLGELLGRPPLIVGQEAETAWLNNAQRTHARFGAPATSVADMMQWTAAWLTRVGLTWGKPTGFERRDGRY